MSLLEKLRKDMFMASKEKDVRKAEILKMAIAAIKDEEIKKQAPLSELDEVKVLRREEKKIKDSVEQYSAVGREDLVEIEKYQLECVQQYLPGMMSEDDLKKLIQRKIVELGVDSPAGMGKVMGAVMTEVEGNADGAMVNQIVKELLVK